MGMTPAERQRAYRERRMALVQTMNKIDCACGCGTKIAPLTKQGKQARFALGHNAKLEPIGKRFQSGHRTWNKGMDTDPVGRFWAMVAKDDGCWEWRGCISRGYGQIAVNGTMVLAHRFSYELNVGAIGDGLRVCHRCDNRKCVNPDHLFLGTDADNMRDMVNKGRQKRQNGEANHMARLTESDVRNIRAALDTGPHIAKRFGITKSAVYAIRSGKAWKHLA